MSAIRIDLINTIAGIIDGATDLKQGSRLLAEEVVDEVLRNLPVKPGRNYTVDKAIARVREAAHNNRPIEHMDCEIVFAAYHALTEAPQQLNTDLFKPIPDDGGWFTWDGRQDEPLPAGTRVEAQMRNGQSTGLVLSHRLQWAYDKDDPRPWDLVRYRPLSENNSATYLDMPTIRTRISCMSESEALARENVDELLEISRALLSEADKLREVTTILLK